MSAKHAIQTITEYLSNGGLFNPEMMDHDRVRNLLMECRDSLIELSELVDSLNLALLNNIKDGLNKP